MFTILVDKVLVFTVYANKCLAFIILVENALRLQPSSPNTLPLQSSKSNVPSNHISLQNIHRTCPVRHRSPLDSTSKSIKSEAHSTKDFSSALDENGGKSKQIKNRMVSAKSCTCHDSTAVVICATFCSDLISRKWVTTNCHCYLITILG